MSSLPNFVNVILTNEFEDDPYWTKGIETDLPEAYTAISNLQKSPSDPQKYMESLEIYRKYIGDIIDYYGGQNAIDAYYKENEEYPKGYMEPPKLRMKKETKNFVKTGYIAPKVGQYSRPLNIGELNSIGDEMFGVPEDEQEEIRLYKPKNKAFRKQLKKTAESFSDHSKSDPYSSNLNLAARYNVIAQYFEQTQAASDADISEINTSKMSIKELSDLYDVQQRQEEDEWVPVQNINPNRVEYRESRLVPTGRLQKSVDWANLLKDNGFERAATKYLKQFDACDKQYIKQQTGIQTKSKKDLEKKRKKYEKDKKRMRKGDSLRSLAHIMSRTSSGVSSDIDDDTLDVIVRHSKE